MVVDDFIKAYDDDAIDVVLHNSYSGLTIIADIEVIRKDQNLWFLRDADVKSWNIDGCRIRIEYT